MAATTPIRHLYQNFECSNEKIRLLELKLSRDEHSAIKCSLITADLNEKAEYLALSYVWGDPNVTETIYVNSIPFQATINLAQALRAIRLVALQITSEKNHRRLFNFFGLFRFGPSLGRFSRGRRLLIWVDAICIDQRNPEEKSYQVSLMTEIYSAAYAVISWLGPVSDDSHLAVDAVSAIHSAKPENWTPRDFNNRTAHHDWLKMVPHLWENSDGPNDYNQYWKAIRKLLERPYWYRCWIIQEVTMAKVPLFLLGTKFMPFEAFVTLRRLLSDFEYGSPTFANLHLGSLRNPSNSIATIARYRNNQDSIRQQNNTVVSGFEFLNTEIYRYVGRIFTLKPSELQITHHLLATDPRDKIFAFSGLGLASQKPDYTKTTKEVYAEFARSWLESRIDVDDFWWMVGIGYTDTRDHELPSWVIDWHQLSLVDPFGRMRYELKLYEICQRLPRGTIKVDSSFNLVTPAYLVDKATMVYPEIGGEQTFTAKFWAVMNVVVRTLFLHEDTVNNSRVHPLKRLFRTLAFYTVLDASRHIEKDKYWEFRLAKQFLKLFVRPQHFGVAFLLGNNPVMAGEAFTLEADAAIDFPAYCHKLLFQDDPRMLDFIDQWPKSHNELLNQNDKDAFLELLYNMETLSYHRLFQTSSGLLGRGPPLMKDDDIIVVLPSCRLPIVMRLVGQHYLLVGLCFVYGLMNGEIAEMVEREELRSVDIEIH